jgi:hypothetical protein
VVSIYAEHICCCCTVKLQTRLLLPLLLCAAWIVLPLQPRPVLASALVVVLGLLLSLTGFLLLMTLEYLPDLPSRCVEGLHAHILATCKVPV